MNCPLCNVELKMTDRQGIEIDYCPKCRGVWLDRGELDKIIERSVQPSVNYNENRDFYIEHDDNHHYNKHGYEDKHRKHKRGGFLGEIFDFD